MPGEIEENHDSLFRCRDSKPFYCVGKPTRLRAASSLVVAHFKVRFFPILLTVQR